jgi:two-component system OmpR family response regulator
MDSPFRSSRFDKLLVECGRLVTGAGDHERALNDLADRLEGESPAVVATARRVAASARLQRQRAETLHAGLIGEPVANRQPDAGRPVVLVVDDSQDGLETVALFLELSGFHAITAANGLEALIAAHYARPAVAVLDVAMPVLNGLEAARLLKASPVTRNMRLMAYTANWSTSDAALKEVFAEVMAKPASADEFLATIRQLAAGGEASPPS